MLFRDTGSGGKVKKIDFDLGQDTKNKIRIHNSGAISPKERQSPRLAKLELNTSGPLSPNHTPSDAGNRLNYRFEGRGSNENSKDKQSNNDETQGVRFTIRKKTVNLITPKSLAAIKRLPTEGPVPSNQNHGYLNELVKGSTQKSPLPATIEEETTKQSSTKIPNEIRWSGNVWPNIKEELHFGEAIGQGSFAVVYEGFDLVEKVPVAIKVMEKKKIIEKNNKSMIEKELQIISGLNHPNICRFYRLLEDHKRVLLHYRRSSSSSSFADLRL